MQPAQIAAAAVVAAEQVAIATASTFVVVATAAGLLAVIELLAVEDPVAACKPEIAAESVVSVAVVAVKAEGRTVAEAFVEVPVGSLLDLPSAAHQ